MENAVFEWLIGVVLVPIVNWLKAKFGLENEAAMLLTFGASIAFAFLYLFVQGDLTGADFAWEAVGALIGKVLAAATLVYNLLLPYLQKAGARLVGK